MCLDPSGIHEIAELIGGFALAALVDSGEDDDDGKVGLQQVRLNAEQTLAECRNSLLVFAVRDGESQLGCFEHSGFP